MLSRRRGAGDRPRLVDALARQVVRRYPRPIEAPRRPRLIALAIVSVLLAAAAVELVPAAVDELRSEPGGSSAGRCPPRPYDPRSPWNTPVGSSPAVHPNSAAFVRAIADNGLPLTSDPDQYTPAVYRFSKKTPRRTVELSGWYSTYDSGDRSRVGHGHGSTQRIPVPAATRPPAGTDSQIVLLDPKRRVEYGLWQFQRSAGGQITATNAYRYHTGRRYHGRFADGLAGRGAGLPYLGGLVRPCELARRRIDHALAFAYDSPAASFVYPASKSDGVGETGVDLPEGTRLQLDPGLGNSAFDAWGLSPGAKAIARALQKYGMYVVDNSGSSKIFLESRRSARWNRGIGRNLVSGIPWNEFRVVRAAAPSR